MAKIWVRNLIGVLFVGAGLFHFLRPQPFVAIVPSYLPAPRALVLVSGAAEMAGGMGLFVPRLRRMAGFGLIALLVAVFPANVFMLTNQPFLMGQRVPTWALWLRLPLQPALMALIGWCISREKKPSAI